MSNRLKRFVNSVKTYATDDSYGYSQKPPSGRWGPDYDCSSLIYQAANDAGYLVGTGSDKVRFTGTMLKDFEKAGFQILPFANVGVSDLQIGDILLNLALHAEVYVGNGESVGATSSETGGFVGEAGDQTGSEIEKHPVTTFSKEWDYILRPPTDDDEEGDEEVPPMNYNHPGQGTNIAVSFDGSPLLETTMISQTAAAGDLNNVNRETAVNTCCCAGGAITLVNTGTTDVNLGANPLLYIRRVA